MIKNITQFRRARISVRTEFASDVAELELKVFIGIPENVGQLWLNLKTRLLATASLYVEAL